MDRSKKMAAEFIGTFVLVLFGCGSAVLGGDKLGLLGISCAFGLSIVAMAYTLGTASGCHVNPAVSFAMLINGRMSLGEFFSYVIAQVAGALAGSGMLALLLSFMGKGTEAMGQNLSSVGIGGAVIAELVLTFVFVLVVINTTGKLGAGTRAGMVIGLTLILIHILGIPLTGTSVNPARSLAPALFAGGEALSQVWIYLAAPMVGGALAALVSRVFGSEGR